VICGGCFVFDQQNRNNYRYNTLALIVSFIYAGYMDPGTIPRSGAKLSNNSGNNNDPFHAPSTFKTVLLAKNVSETIRYCGM
jgi:hypothetical protein